MKSLDWPYPSVLAGSLRTLLGKQNGEGFSRVVVDKLKKIDVAGPFPMVSDGQGEQLYFPAPRDLVVHESDDEGRRAVPLRPMRLADGEGCDLPPGLLPVSVTEDGKPARAPAFWSYERMTDWLLNPTGKRFEAPPADGAIGSGYFDVPGKDERIHVAIDPKAGAAEEGLLFMTVGLDLNAKGVKERVSLSVRVEAENRFGDLVGQLDAFHPLGGEQRLVRWRTRQNHPPAWTAHEKLREALEKSKPGQGIRMILATPAMFKEGWMPGWIGDGLTGCPPGTQVELKLVGACVGRWKPISGWSLEAGKVGPKPVRRLVPAGSVYFFEAMSGNAESLVGDMWLRSVCDEDDFSQERRDGFGLALWGLWNR
jgi:CRISPR-associated protein Cmr3